MLKPLCWHSLLDLLTQKRLFLSKFASYYLWFISLLNVNLNPSFSQSFLSIIFYSQILQLQCTPVPHSVLGHNFQILGQKRRIFNSHNIVWNSTFKILETLR